MCYKEKINSILENRYVEVGLMILIVLNILVFIFDTEPSIRAIYDAQAKQFEHISVFVFTIEYILRVLSLKRPKDIFKPIMIVDLLAVLPFYLSLMALNTVCFRVLRAFRLLRLFKLNRYFTAWDNIKKSFMSKKAELVVTGCLFSVGIILASVCIYYAEYETGNPAFQSIPSSFWWSIITFTAVGYGDTYPITVAGKIIASIVAILGVGLHGLLIGLLGAAFIDAFHRPQAEAIKASDSSQELQAK